MSTLTKWEHPSDYGGFSPDGDYMIAGQSRDSDALERSNYRTIFAALERESAKHAEPEDGEAWVYDFRAGHWAVGWVEQLMIRQDAPESIISAAEEIEGALSNYPVFDEEDFCELEEEEAHQYWSGESLEYRVEMIQQWGTGECNIFAARHDYPPRDSGIHEYLRSC